MFLYQFYDQLEKQETFEKTTIPHYITENLKYPLRDYQKSGLKRYLYHFIHNYKKSKEHLLLNMATGSGKTMMMAGFMLEKYRQGERNFIFLVNRENIITKTRDNLTNSSTRKYLFADKIEIDGKLVTVREVDEFSDSVPTAMNVHFTTIQKLHMDLNNPRENRLSYEQFEEMSIVILADEAHHLNAGLKKSEKDENTSWTFTIEEIQRRALKSSILELTATIDLSNPEIKTKYEDKLLYKYDLKDFRLDGFSKDVLIHQVDSEVENRMLHAVLISQFRKKVASNNGIYLKPVVMFKSKSKVDNESAIEKFNELINSLTISKLEQVRGIATEGILKQAIQYFEKHGISDLDLISELQEDFREERAVLIDSSVKEPEKSKILKWLNTMENFNNEIRAIFSVDMLNEGWDILNLFDIVRLYDTRDGRTDAKGVYKPGATTISEIQLIGRGARYNPFVINDDFSKRDRRKFDDDLINEMRVLEQLHYHSKSNSRYITELKQVLTQSGIFDNHVIEQTMRLKESFKSTRTYTNGKVYVNDPQVMKKTIEDLRSDFSQKEQLSLFGEKDNLQRAPFELEMPTYKIQDTEIFKDEVSGEDISSATERFTLGNKNYGITDHIIRKAINGNKSFTMEKIAKTFLGVESISAFTNELKNIELVVTGRLKDDRTRLHFSQDEKLYIVKALLKDIEERTILSEDIFKGGDFVARDIKDLFSETIIRRYPIGGGEEGKSQITGTDRYQLNLNDDSRNWYAYNDNFGTSEEKSFVKELDTKIPLIF